MPNSNSILWPILVFALSYLTCKLYKISYAETRRRFRYRTDELGGHEAVSLVRVILGEGLGRSRGDSRWKVASLVVAGKVGRLGPPDVSQPVLRDVSLWRIDMGHTDGRSLSCRDPVLLVRVKEELRGDRQSPPVEGPLFSGSLCLHELGGDMQHCLLEVSYGVHSSGLCICCRSLCLPCLCVPVHCASPVRWQWLSTAKLLPRCLSSALDSLMQRPHRIVMLKPKFIFEASKRLGIPCCWRTRASRWL